MSIQLNCAQLIEYLSDYIDRNLSEELTQAARAHLESCHNCHVVLDSTQKMILLYREREQARQIPAERQQRLYDTLAATFARRDQSGT